MQSSYVGSDYKGRKEEDAVDLDMTTNIGKVLCKEIDVIRQYHEESKQLTNAALDNGLCKFTVAITIRGTE